VVTAVSAAPATRSISELGIGCIGSGGIVNGAHIPQYQQLGFRVVGCVDIVAETAAATAAKWNLPFHSTDYRELLARPDVDVVLIAIRPEGRREIVEAAVAAGKHVLIEKPFAHSYEDAAAMVRASEAAGVKLAVNQNRRWMPAHAETRKLIDTGAIGDAFAATYLGRANQEYLVGTWYERDRHFLLIEFCVHQIDLLLYWLGEPDRVFATNSRSPGQKFAHDMVTSVSFIYDGDRQAQLVVNDVAWFGEKPGYRDADDFTIDGTSGVITKLDDLSIRLSNRETGDDARTIALAQSDHALSFGYSMRDLLEAVVSDREPASSGRNNLATMRTVFAACRSADEGRVVALDEIAREFPV
jgi:predicted dehydrogenase